jgi:hypothetical protein
MTGEAWESIHKICIGVYHVKVVNVDRLWQEFAEIKFKPGKGVEDFSLHITANELWALCDEVTDKGMVKKMLHSVQEKLEPVAISMETLLDLSCLSIEEVVGHLWAVEQRKKSSTLRQWTLVGFCCWWRRSGLGGWRRRRKEVPQDLVAAAREAMAEVGRGGASSNLLVT